MRKFLIIFNLLFSSFLLAQSQQLDGTIIYGKIYNADDTSGISDVNVLNYKNAEGTISDESGNFTLRVFPGDSVLFSAVGYEKYVIRLKDTLQNKRFRLDIYLMPKTYELKMITIYEYYNRPRKLEVQGEYDQVLKESRTKPSLSPVQSSSGAGFAISGLLTSIYEEFSKTEREKRKLRSQLKDEYYKRYLETSYRRVMIKELTGLKDSEIENFLGYCDFASSYGKDYNYYELAALIRGCYELYLIEKQKVN